MPTEMAFDALSRNEQCASLCFIKFKFIDQTILFIQKATFQFCGPFLKPFHTYPQKYEQYVFKHLVMYMICICISQDRFRLLDNGKYNYKKFQSVLGTATENSLCFTKRHTKKV